MALLSDRPRRNRKSAPIRSWLREAELRRERLVQPLFIHDDREERAIASMPGCVRHSPEGLLREVDACLTAGLTSVVLFPAIPEGLKTPTAQQAFREDDLVPRSVRALKERFPELVVITDIALDPYNSDGHDGLVGANGKIRNDETVELLCRQALVHANAGADVVSPSDMMDGRVGAIRRALDEGGHQDVSILAYTAKYASAFYGPFRDALDSAPRAGDKKTYQMDPANVREALREVACDVAERADMIMVKPAGPYLDVIAAVRAATVLPVAAYQVSGEYAMLMAAIQNGWLAERPAILESLTSIRRAGADLILSYFARKVAPWLDRS